MTYYGLIFPHSMYYPKCTSQSHMLYHAEKMEDWCWYDGRAGFVEYLCLLEFSVPDIPKHPQQSGVTEGHDEGTHTALSTRPSRSSASNKKEKESIIKYKHSITYIHVLSQLNIHNIVHSPSELVRKSVRVGYGNDLRVVSLGGKSIAESHQAIFVQQHFGSQAEVVPRQE